MGPYKARGPVRGKYFDCYMMVDIHSRLIVGAHVHATESGVLAVEMMKGIVGIHGIPQVVHADRGTSMTSKTVAALLSDLEVPGLTPRPRVSDDNPYSEARFKTLKNGPEFPERSPQSTTPGHLSAVSWTGTTITTSTPESASIHPRTWTTATPPA